MSYWIGEGKEQTKLDILHKLIDIMLNEKGTVKNPVANKHLERLRKAKNAYYRLMNDGDPAARLLGVTRDDLNSVHLRHRVEETAEEHMDTHIRNAWDEQWNNKNLFMLEKVS